MRYLDKRVYLKVRKRLSGSPHRDRRSGAGSPPRILSLAPVLLCCLLACTLSTAGCSRGNSEVEELVWSFVDAVGNQDTDTLERIIDWERYYEYGKSESEGRAQRSEPLDIEKEKRLLLAVFGRDRMLALNYLTADNSIEKISVNGNEAKAELLQVDRATGEERVITVLMNKVEGEGWKIYRFSTEAIEE